MITHILSQSRKFYTFFVIFVLSGANIIHFYKHSKKRNKIVITPYNAGMQAGNSCSTALMDNRALVHQLLNTAQSLPPIKRRAVFAVVGAAVADAAIRPFHWVYDRPTLQAVIGDNPCPEFWPTNVSPFYDIPTGRRSCYNDIGLTMLRSLQGRRHFDRSAFLAALQDMFLPPSEYAAALQLRKEAYDPAKRLVDRQPIPGPWQQGAVTYLLEAVAGGRADTSDPKNCEGDGFCSVVPLVAMLSSSTAPVGEKELFGEVRSGLAVLSSHPVAVSHAMTSAGILNKIIAEGSEMCQVDTVKQWLQIQRDAMSVEDIDYAALNAELDVIKSALEADEDALTFIERNGWKPCAYPGSFMGGMYVVGQAAKVSGGFTGAIRNLIRSGGCSCSKGNFAGACLGAAYGISDDTLTQPGSSGLGIPVSWVLRTHGIEEILTASIAMVRADEE